MHAAAAMDDSMSGTTAVAALMAGGALHGARDVRGGAGYGLRGGALDAFRSRGWSGWRGI